MGTDYRHTQRCANEAAAARAVRVAKEFSTLLRVLGDLKHGALSATTRDPAS